MAEKTVLERLLDSTSEVPSVQTTEDIKVLEISGIFDSPPDLQPAQQRSPRVFTAEKKLEVVAFAKKSSIRAASKHYGIDRKRIREWRDREAMLRQMDPNQKRAKGAGRPVKSKDFDRTIAELVENAAKSGEKINRRFILEKATQLLTQHSLENVAELKLSHGWMDSFLKRHQLIKPKSKSIDEQVQEMAQNSITIQDFLNGLDLPASTSDERANSPSLDCLTWLVEACRQMEACRGIIGHGEDEKVTKEGHKDQLKEKIASQKDESSLEPPAKRRR